MRLAIDVITELNTYRLSAAVEADGVGTVTVLHHRRNVGEVRFVNGATEGELPRQLEALESHIVGLYREAWAAARAGGP